jgi:hypothetical protein
MACPAKPVRSQSCEAILSICGIEYEGKTGKDKGHAEMTALDAFIRSQPSIAQAATILAARRNYVSCPSRPVCLKCGTVLRALRFACDADTEWGTQTMGSTEWGVSLKVRDLLKQVGIDYEDVKSLTSG